MCSVIIDSVQDEHTKEPTILLCANKAYNGPTLSYTLSFMVWQMCDKAQMPEVRIDIASQILTDSCHVLIRLQYQAAIDCHV